MGHQQHQQVGSSPGKSEGGGREDLELSLESIIAFNSPEKSNNKANMDINLQALKHTVPIAASGWAAVAASNVAANGHKPPLLSSSPPTAVEAAIAWKQQQLSSFAHATVGSKAVDRDPNMTRISSRVSPRIQTEILRLCSSVPGLRLDDFDEGVVHQLNQKRSEDEAVAALRALSGGDVSMLQHPAAYLNHIIKGFHSSSSISVQSGMANLPSVGSGVSHQHLAAQNGGGGLGASRMASGTNPLSAPGTTPVTAKLLLQKLPLRVFKRLEEIVSRSNDLDWKHFDAGVIKVLGQLSELGDEDVTEELELLNSTDLSAVEYMPAYLNKRLNNRLWSKRKMRQQQQQQLGAPVPT